MHVDTGKYSYPGNQNEKILMCTVGRKCITFNLPGADTHLNLHPGNEWYPDATSLYFSAFI